MSSYLRDKNVPIAPNDELLKSLKDNTVPENIIQKSTDWMTLSFIINLRFLTINLGTFFGDISILVQTTGGQSCLISAIHADFDEKFSTFDAAEH